MNQVSDLAKISTVESRNNGYQGTWEKVHLNGIYLIGGSTKWARSMDFDRPTALSDSLYQANNELKPVIRFENAEHLF